MWREKVGNREHQLQSHMGQHLNSQRQAKAKEPAISDGVGGMFSLSFPLYCWVDNNETSFPGGWRREMIRRKMDSFLVCAVGCLLLG
jgi:hypothetical protein